MHEVTAMPQNANDFVWWGFNLAFLAVVWFMKRDLGEIKADTKANREQQEANASDIKEHRAICEERHRRLDLEIVDMKGKTK
jgi:hypothetical protein